MGHGYFAWRFVAGSAIRVNRMRNNWQKGWRTGTLLIVVVVAVVNVVQTAQTVPPPPADAPSAAIDPVRRQERRLAALHERVRAHGLTGVVGYIGDPPGGRLLEEENSVADFYLTQFVLVPLVLDAQPEAHEWAVANLRATTLQTRVPSGWRVVEDFGDGVILLRKAAP